MPAVAAFIASANIGKFATIIYINAISFNFTIRNHIEQIRIYLCRHRKVAASTFRAFLVCHGFIACMVVTFLLF